MSGLRETNNEPPLEALVERLNELTRQLPHSHPLRSMAELTWPTLAAQSQPPGSTERVILAELQAAVKRVEIAQAQSSPEVRPEIVQAIGRMASVLQQGAMLSEDAIQKLRVALGGAGNAERRILDDLAEVKASLADLATKSTKNPRRGRVVLVALGLGIILFVAGLTVGVLMAPYLGAMFLDVVR